MKKRILSIILAIILVASVVPVSAATITDFTDIKSGDWYYDAVKYAVDEGLFTGTDDDKFSPDEPMTRGMFVTVLGRKSDVPESYGRDKSTPFNDITQRDYFYPFAVWANDNGIASGVGNKNFAPTDSITREQMATMLHRYAEFAKLDMTSSDTKYNQFPDINLVSTYAIAPLKWATSHEIINGSGGKIDPKGKATRAQVAQIFFNMSDMETDIDNPDDNGNENENSGNDWENYDPQYVRKTGKSAVDASGGYYDYDLANEIMDLVDDLRIQNGLNKLEYHPKIQEWSNIRAIEHITTHNDNDATPHIRPNGTAWSTVGYSLSAENLVWGDNYSEYYHSTSNQKEYAKMVVDSWYGSSGHRQNMLSYTARIGSVSCYVKGNYIYVAHLFSKSSLYIFDHTN